MSMRTKDALKAANDLDLSAIFESTHHGSSSGVVLNDRLIAEASLGFLPPPPLLHPLPGLENLLPGAPQTPAASAEQLLLQQTPIKSEHSYSLNEDPPCKELSEDLERECFPAIPISEADGSRTLLQGSPTGLHELSSCSPKLPIVDANYFENDVMEASSETLSCCDESDFADDFVLDDSMCNAGADFSVCTYSSDSPFEDEHQPPISSTCKCSSEVCRTFSHASFTNYNSSSINSSTTIPSKNLSSCCCQSWEIKQERGGGGVEISDSKAKLASSTMPPSDMTPPSRIGSPPPLASLDDLASMNALTSCSSSASNFTSLFKDVDVLSCYSGSTLGGRDPKTGRISCKSSSSNSNSESSIIHEPSRFCLPPTPPSCSGSDSESGGHSPPSSPLPLYEVLPQFCSTRKIKNATRTPITTPLISSQPKGATGILTLTDEEKRTLVSEGYPIPSRLPLTKAEEKSLKKIRRKIKNKISAQESRRKKKEYMDTLETRVELLEQENSSCKKRIEALQQKNSTLLEELRKLQNIVVKEETNVRRATDRATLLN